ncbi:hypothetical protein FHS68_004029 [Dyadobacter arcticus]|uniref:DUF3592 domain-containing protein n=1 Tax=Dyadobacter arcticus TaxID=1078754 RepID=A0ABX0UPC1_9BACT|nr:hypothetical protein [Dyadobacter arcticus]
MHSFTFWKLFVTTLTVAIFALVRFLLHLQKARDFRFLVQFGIRSTATILSLEQIRPTEGQTLRPIRLGLQIHPENERNYVTEVTIYATSTQLQFFKIGSKVHVKYNPRRRKQVLIISEGNSYPIQ